MNDQNEAPVAPTSPQFDSTKPPEPLDPAHATIVCPRCKKGMGDAKWAWRVDVTPPRWVLVCQKHEGEDPFAYLGQFGRPVFREYTEVFGKSASGELTDNVFTSNDDLLAEFNRLMELGRKLPPVEPTQEVPFTLQGLADVMDPEVYKRLHGMHGTVGLADVRQQSHETFPDSEFPLPGERFTHYKREGKFTVVALARCKSTDGVIVTYRSESTADVPSRFWSCDITKWTSRVEDGGLRWTRVK